MELAEAFRILGRRRRIIGTVTTLEPHRTLGYEYAAGPIPGLWTYRILHHGERTRLDSVLEMSSGGFVTFGNALVSLLIEREIPKNLASFGSWVDTQSAAGAGVEARHPGHYEP